jgi:hypothetical protein
MAKPEDFEELATDEWMMRKSTIHPAKLHALGVITFAWNTCELHLLFLFCFVADLDTMVGRIIAHDLGDIAISDRIRELLHAKNYEQNVVNLIENVLDVYDACRQNRNSLTHFHIEKLDGEFLLARIKGPKWTTYILPNGLKDFRRVAEEIWELSLWLRKIWRELANLRDGLPASLPQIQPVPELLWKPPQQGPIKQPRQPRPSRASRRRAALARREPRDS